MILMKKESRPGSRSTNRWNAVHFTLPAFRWKRSIFHQSLEEFIKTTLTLRGFYLWYSAAAFLNRIGAPFKPANIAGWTACNLRASSWECTKLQTTLTEPATKDINVINKMQLIEDPKLAIQLQQALDQVTKCLKALKTSLQPTGVNQTACDHNPLRYHGSKNCSKYALIVDHDLPAC